MTQVIVELNHLYISDGNEFAEWQMENREDYGRGNVTERNSHY